MGDGVTTIYPFSFAGQDLGYLAASNVVVYVAGTAVPFTIPRNDPNKAYLTSAPPIGAEVLIRRIMPKNVPYSDFARGNPFSQDALNNTNLQQLYIVQEILDGYMPTGFYFKSDINMGGNKLVNLGEGTQAGDSVRYEQWLDNKERLDRLELGLVDNVAQRTIPWYYIATGGEVELSPPYEFQAALVYRGGMFQNQGLGAFSITDNKFKLAEPLEPKEEFYSLLGSSPAAPDDYAKLSEVIRLIEESKNTRELWSRSLAEIGINLAAGTVQSHAVVHSANDAVWDSVGAQCYTYLGTDYPKSSSPDTVPGIGWVVIKSPYNLVNVVAKSNNKVFATIDGKIKDDGSDVSASVRSFLNSNKGKHIVFDGKIYDFCGVVLSGSGWEGTTIEFIGTHRLTSHTLGTTNYDGAWVGLVLSEGVSGLTLIYRGDGNRLSMPPREHHFNVVIAGATKIEIPYANIKNVRGDGIYVTRQFSTYKNSADIRMGYIYVENDTQDGRNGVSVVSCSGGYVHYFYSKNVGGTINGVVQPGGIDIEPNADTNQTFLVENFVVQEAMVINPGNMGAAIVGNITNLELVKNCHIRNAIVIGQNASLRLMGATDCTLSGVVRDSSAPATFISSALRCDLIAKVFNAPYAGYVGYRGIVTDCNVDVEGSGLTNSGLAITQAKDSNIKLTVHSFDFTATNLFGLYFRNLSTSGSPNLNPTVDACTFSLICPRSSGAVRGVFLESNSPIANVSFIGDNKFSESTNVIGYPDKSHALGVPGRYIRKSPGITEITLHTGKPNEGFYKKGDMVVLSELDSRGVYGYYRLTDGGFNDLGTDWGVVKYSLSI